MSGRRALGLLACGLALLVLTASGLYAQRATGPEEFVAVALAQGGVYLLALALTWRCAASPRVLAVILGIAATMRIVVLIAPPLLSSDIYRYVWDGRVLAAGINPYRYIPTDPHLASLRDAEIFPEINRSNYAPTIYPPAAEVIFLAVAGTGGGVTAMKAAMVAFEAIAVLVLLRLFAVMGLPRTRIIVYAWHPLPLWEFAGSGHIDAAVIAFVVLALWTRRRSSALSFRGRQSGNPEPMNTRLSRAAPTVGQGRPDPVFMGSGFGAARRPGMTLTGVALALGVLVKFYPAVLFPALWRREWRMPAAFATVLALAYLPFLGVGWQVFGFLPGYLAEEGFTGGGAGFYLWSAAHAMLPRGGVPDIAYIAGAACLLAGLALYLGLRRERPDSDVFGAALLAAAFTFLLSPHYSWYFAWLIVFTCLVPSASLLWLTLASFLLYLVPVGSQLVRDRHRFFVESALYVPFLMLAAMDLWRRRAPRAAKEQLRHGDTTG